MAPASSTGAASTAGRAEPQCQEWSSGAGHGLGLDLRGATISSYTQTSLTLREVMPNRSVCAPTPRVGQWSTAGRAAAKRLTTLETAGACTPCQFLCAPPQA